jgi:threonine dehydrogenase-like Zn-dependent dehydrogenase
VKAVVLQSGNRFALEDVPRPKLLEDGDALVRVTTAAICGSDLHAMHGLIPGLLPGTVIGHEFVGIVEEAGSNVSKVKKGDRVAASPASWCGTCQACKRDETQYCENGGAWGCGDIVGKGLSGAQAEFIRVAYADNCLCHIPETLSDEQAVLVGDVFSTGYHAAYEGRIRPGDIVVIFGCGPVGLGALVSARLFEPRQVVSVDILANRLSMAKHYGATVIDGSQDEELDCLVKEATSGRGVDVVIEAIGNNRSFLRSLELIRRGGTVSVVGIFPGPAEIPLGTLCHYGLRVSMGLGNLSRVGYLMSLVESGRVDLTRMITHRFDLSRALEAYDLFENHRDKCLKVLLKP